MDARGYGCDWYEEQDLPGCPYYGYEENYVGEMDPASEHCCYCDPTVSHLCIIVWNEDVI